MKAILITGIATLLVGIYAGTQIEWGNTDSMKEVEQIAAKLETPEPVDFVSLRPEVESLPVSGLSVEEINGLVFMREEEKLARDVYSTLYEKWGLRIFSNIAQSEQTHTEAIRDLLEKYNLDDPVANDAVGIFTNAELQKLYDDLVEQGSGSEVEALTVGALIEDLDIADLERYLGETDNEDIRLVYENLQRGSRNHLRAFNSQLSMRGVEYAPQYISTEELNSIIGSDRETGMGGGMGQGGSRGMRGWGN